MNDVFRPFFLIFVLVFFDDIVVYSSTCVDHLTHIEQVLQRLRPHQLVAKKSKFLYGQESIGYLGHIIFSQGVVFDLGKIHIITKWPQPTTVKEVRSFLGLTGYYRCFIRHYATVVRPLSHLFKKDNFYWNS